MINKRELFKIELSVNRIIGLLIALILMMNCASAISIRDDATGGDCTLIGTWDPSTKTCMLTTDLENLTIEIDNDEITLDGNGHELINGFDYSGFGLIISERSGVKIKNLIIGSYWLRKLLINIFFRSCYINEQ